MEKLQLVNTFFNQLRFVDDKEHWGENDYWATPVEMLSSSAGDCEDFAIAKYFSLLELGVPAERMRLIYVKATSLNRAHMVLAYYGTREAEPLILDNLIEQIRAQSGRPDLIPIYSFNGEGVWIAVAQGREKRIGSATRLQKWRDLTHRMQVERS